MKLNQKTRAKWLKERHGLWWSTSQLDKLSDEVILEAVMNYGQWEDFLDLKQWWGLKKIKQLFEQMMSKRRVNLRQPVQVLFHDYLAAHVHWSFDQKPAGFIAFNQ